MLNAQNPEMLRAALGVQVDDFLRGDIGQYISDRATMQMADAMDKLKKADAGNPEIIRQLQMAIAIPERVLDWLRDAMIEGAEAHQNLVEEQQ